VEAKTVVARTPENARFAPTERSIPPLMMTKVIPTATMAVTDTCRAMFRRFSGVKKYSVENENTRHKMTRARISPYCLSRSKLIKSRAKKIVGGSGAESVLAGLLVVLVMRLLPSLRTEGHACPAL
jgi:hypothetical protein